MAPRGRKLSPLLQGEGLRWQTLWCGLSGFALWLWTSRFSVASSENGGSKGMALTGWNELSDGALFQPGPGTEEARGECSFFLLFLGLSASPQRPCRLLSSAKCTPGRPRAAGMSSHMPRLAALHRRHRTFYPSFKALAAGTGLATLLASELTEVSFPLSGRFSPTLFTGLTPSQPFTVSSGKSSLAPLTPKQGSPSDCPVLALLGASPGPQMANQVPGCVHPFTQLGCQSPGEVAGSVLSTIVANIVAWLVGHAARVLEMFLVP